MDVKALERFGIEVGGALSADRVMDVDVGGRVDVERELTDVTFREGEAPAER